MPTPDKLDILREFFRDATDSMHVSMPARVVTYNKVNQSVSVRPSVLLPFQDEALDSGVGFREIPIISGIPVAFPRGGGSFITWQLVPGDNVMLVFASHSIDDWLQLGGIAVDRVQPESDRRFNISDAWAIPGVSPFDSPIPGNAAHADLTIDAITEIKLGAAATDFAAAAAKVLSELSTIISDFNAHTHAVTTAPGTTAVPVPQMAPASSVAAVKVKVE